MLPFALALAEGDMPKPKQARRAQQEQQVRQQELPLTSGGEQLLSAPTSAAAPLISPAATTFNTPGAALVVRRAGCVWPPRPSMPSALGSRGSRACILMLDAHNG
mgnify:CR=1 FL=1